jgi:uncharacterized protein YbjT (DUF2867 family)
MGRKTASIIGATGLTGSFLYELLRNDQDFETIRLIVRRPLPKPDDRTEIKLVDFSDTESLMLAIDGSDIVFCAVGTTNKKVKGDKEAYRKVDYDIPVRAARCCKMTGCNIFVLVSAVGANSKSGNFYWKLKGEVEEAVQSIGLKSVHILRPSLLLGDRKELRTGEKLGKQVMQSISFLLPSKYKPLQAMDVAKAMIIVAKENREGNYIYEYKQIEQLSHTS